MKQKHSVYVPELGITLSTGTLARQANGAITIQLGDTIVFVSATVSHTVVPHQTFLPLTVEYKEKYAAAGRFPGGYFKREGRPSEKEVLTSRLCDRPLRPLFPKGFVNEVQIIGYLLSADLSNEPDVLMVNGASAALMCSDIPWAGPIGCVRISEINGEFVVNPTNEQMFDSQLDLVYVGTADSMLMIEGSADQLSEERFIEALEFAHASIQPILKAQIELAAKAHKAKHVFPVSQLDPVIKARCKELCYNRLYADAFIGSKVDRDTAVLDLQAEVLATLKEEISPEIFNEKDLRALFEKFQHAIYRDAILDEGKRVDGRGLNDLRAIHCDVDVLPRVHGSAIFERGQTQALVIATLGTSRDIQDLDALTGGATSKSFILHYNFPPFSVGEVGRFNSTSRREMGHGALAERSLLPIIPSEDEFPYTIRLVSEIFESNGSTSMASICGGTLALMAAGVPILAPVSGISIGIVTRHDENKKITQYALLTDILGVEDHFGDMDFKIAGTQKGITGFQLDLKIPGIPLSIAKEAIRQNTVARLDILKSMHACMPEARSELKEHAPRIHKMQIDPEKIGMLIGPGGKNIKRITEISGAKIDINEDNSGRVLVYASSQEALERAVHEIDLISSDIEVGKTYRGVVRTVKEFGAFVECLPGKEGLVHISELSEARVDRVEDVCNVGDEIIVKCTKSEKGKFSLSRKAAQIDARHVAQAKAQTAPAA